MGEGMMRGVTQRLGIRQSTKRATRRVGGTYMHLLGSKSERLFIPEGGLASWCS